MILYQRLPDNSFEFTEVDNLVDFDDKTNDGRLYRKGDENDLWWVLDTTSVDLFGCSDEYVMALTAYRFERPDLFAKQEGRRISPPYQKYNIIQQKEKYNYDK